MGVKVSFTPLSLYPRGKKFRYPLGRSLGGPLCPSHYTDSAIATQHSARSRLKINWDTWYGVMKWRSAHCKGFLPRQRTTQQKYRRGSPMPRAVSQSFILVFKMSQGFDIHRISSIWNLGGGGGRGTSVVCHNRSLEVIFCIIFWGQGFDSRPASWLSWQKVSVVLLNSLHTNAGIVTYNRSWSRQIIRHCIN
jgi:hypothetical protein